VAVLIRGPRPGDGVALASLWRELWDAHERWGGYAGTKDDAAYRAVAQRLEDDIYWRQGASTSGRHLHLVAEDRGEVVGQVEGWMDRYGVLLSTLDTCEVRSLVVSPTARGLGAGRALLEELARAAFEWSRRRGVVLAAEVLANNPAGAFYHKVGYEALAWSVRVNLPITVPTDPRFRARQAHPRDAFDLARFDGILAERRRAARDVRYDPPRSVDAAHVESIAAYLEQPSQGATDIVVIDERSRVCASATVSVSFLEAPFLPQRRATLSRFAFDPDLHPHLHTEGLMAVLVKGAAERAAALAASTMELVDLPSPGTPIHRAAIAMDARQWSQVLARVIKASA
jgi:GNAT superfamily N-acetyltransferase